MLFHFGQLFTVFGREVFLFPEIAIQAIKLENFVLVSALVGIRV